MASTEIKLAAVSRGWVIKEDLGTLSLKNHTILDMTVHLPVTSYFEEPFVQFFSPLVEVVVTLPTVTPVITVVVVRTVLVVLYTRSANCQRYPMRQKEKKKST